MRIGELSARTGISTRMLRYYESQGLLRPDRAGNGYRSFEESDVGRAETIGSLIRSGLPTRLITIVLSAQEAPDRWTEACDQHFVEILRDELRALDEKIACLSRSRNAVRAYLGTVDA